MFDPSVAALFPLPLTAFEKYMLLDDRPDYPMVFAFRLKLCGELRREAFESALDEALLHHPLLCALVKRQSQGGAVWLLAGELKPTIDWGVLGAAIGSPRGEGIDLNVEVGLRIWVRQGDDATELMFQFHHACCDGIGALRFIGHVLAAYGMITAPAGRRPKLHTSDPAGLLSRGRFTAQIPSRGNPARSIWESVRDGIRFISRRPAILRHSKRVSTESAMRLSFLETHWHAFDKAETGTISREAARQGVTVNDLLLRDLFQTLHKWNADRESEAAKQWLRIAVPVNLKNGDNDRMSAANGVSYTFLTRCGGQCADSHELLQGIHRETDVVTRHRRAMLFLRGFQHVVRFPRVIPFYMSPNRCLATAVLSNLGDVKRHFGACFPTESEKIVAGNVMLEDISAAPPVRPKTMAAFLIGKYANTLWLCVRCDPRSVPANDARQLLSSYINRIAANSAMSGVGIRTATNV
jgi:hypothetical protein